AGFQLGLELATRPAGIAGKKSKRLSLLSNELLELVLVGREKEAGQHFRFGSPFHSMKCDERAANRSAQKNRLRALDLFLGDHFPNVRHRIVRRPIENETKGAFL